MPVPRPLSLGVVPGAATRPGKRIIGPAAVGPEHCFRPALLLPAFQPARLCFPDGLSRPRLLRDHWNDCRVSNFGQPAAFALSAAPEKNREAPSGGSALGNDRPITWAVNGFGHQLRLILSLSPFCWLDPRSQRWNDDCCSARRLANGELALRRVGRTRVRPPWFIVAFSLPSRPRSVPCRPKDPKKSEIPAPESGISMSLNGRNLGRSRTCRSETFLYDGFGDRGRAERGSASLSERRHFSCAQRKITFDTKQTAAGTASDRARCSDDSEQKCRP